MLHIQISNQPAVFCQSQRREDIPPQDRTNFKEIDKPFPALVRKERALQGMITTIAVVTLQNFF